MDQSGSGAIVVVLLLALAGLAALVGAGFWAARTAGGGGEPGVLVVPTPELRDLHTVFRESPGGAPLSPEQAFQARDRCPSYTEARYKPGKGGMGLVTLQGQGLDRVQRVVALREGKPLAEAVPHRGPDNNTLAFAVGCTDCALVLGIEVDGLQVGCLGPGYSLGLAGGALLVP